MDSAEIFKVRSLIRTLHEFYGKQCQDSMLDIYVFALADYDFNVVQTALKNIVKTAKFMPRPAEIIELIMQFQGQGAQDIERQKAILEFKASSAFRELMAHLDVGQDIVSDDWRFVFAVRVAFGSLLELAQSEEGNVWLEKKFVKAYLLADDPSRCGHVLGGMYHNTSDPRVRYIGNKDKCKEIAQEFYSDRGMRPRLPTDNVKLLGQNRYALSYKDITLNTTDDDEYVSKEELVKGIKQIQEAFGCAQKL